MVKCVFNGYFCRIYEVGGWTTPPPPRARPPAASPRGLLTAPAATMPFGHAVSGDERRTGSCQKTSALVRKKIASAKRRPRKLRMRTRFPFLSLNTLSYRLFWCFSTPTFSTIPRSYRGQTSILTIFHAGNVAIAHLLAYSYFQEDVIFF